MFQKILKSFTKAKDRPKARRFQERAAEEDSATPLRPEKKHEAFNGSDSDSNKAHKMDKASGEGAVKEQGKKDKAAEKETENRSAKASGRGASPISPRSDDASLKTPASGASTVEEEEDSLQGGLIRRLRFTVPAEEVSSAFERNLQKMQKQAKVIGFRRGKAPLSVIQKTYEGALNKDVLEDLLDRHCSAALQKKGIAPADNPRLISFHLKNKKEAHFELEVEVHPKVQVKNYLRIPIIRPLRHPLQAKEIQEALEKLQQQHTVYRKTDAPLTENLLGVLNLEAFSGRKRFKPLCDNNFKILMGVDFVASGFDLHLKGLRPGRSKEFVFQFPKDHAEKNWAGRTMRFKAFLKNVYEMQAPKQDDQLAKACGKKDFKSLREEIIQSLKKKKEEEADLKVKSDLLNELVKRNPIPLPPSVVESELEIVRGDITENVSKLRLPAHLAKSALKGREKQMEDAACYRVHLRYLIQALADKEQIYLTKKDIQTAVQAVYPSLPLNEAERRIQSNPQAFGALKGLVQRDKVVQWLLDRAEIKSALEKT